MTDWDAIEHAWRFGGLSNVAIANEYGISEGAIRKRAKSEGWAKGVEPGPRQAKPERAVDKPVRADLPSEPRTMQAAVERSIALAHRMLDELDFATSHLEEIEEDIYEATQDDRDGRRRGAMLKAVSLGSRTTSLKTIQLSLDALQVLLAKLEGDQVGSGKKGAAQAAAKKAASKFGAPSPPRHLKAVS